MFLLILLLGSDEFSDEETGRSLPEVIATKLAR
jgi:hypothetical protein